MVSPNTIKQAHKNMADMPDEDGGEGDVMKEEDAGTFIMVVVAISRVTTGDNPKIRRFEIHQAVALTYTEKLWYRKGTYGPILDYGRYSCVWELRVVHDRCYTTTTCSTVSRNVGKILYKSTIGKLMAQHQLVLRRLAPNSPWWSPIWNLLARKANSPSPGS